jgi:hypothetical protein
MMISSSAVPVGPAVMDTLLQTRYSMRNGGCTEALTPIQTIQKLLEYEIYAGYTTAELYQFTLIEPTHETGELPTTFH